MTVRKRRRTTTGGPSLLRCSLALLLAWSGTEAMAEEEWRREARRLAFLDRYDADGDDRVSSLEFEQARRQRFDLTDEDGDGTVSEEEYVYEWEDRLDAQLEKDRAASVQQARSRFDALDRDGDGQLRWAEFERSGTRMFEARDGDEDGVVRADEPPRPRRGEATERRAPDPDARRRRLVTWANTMLRMPSTHRLSGFLEKYDADDDGAVTRGEFDAGRRAEYAALDEDGSGAVHEEEYVFAWEDRVDATLEGQRRDSVRQAGRRFGALDDDEDGRMTFAEYQRSGHRIFERWDGSGDGYVSEDDPLPAPREQLAAAGRDR